MAVDDGYQSFTPSRVPTCDSTKPNPLFFINLHEVESFGRIQRIFAGQYFMTASRRRCGGQQKLVPAGEVPNPFAKNAKGWGTHIKVGTCKRPAQSKIRTAEAMTVVHSPRLSPTADCVTLAVRTILLDRR